MKKLSNWTICGYAIGILFTAISVYRYWFQYNDVDRFLAYTAVGILILAVSFIYNRLLEHSNTITAMGDYLADERKT